jgi:hypothetical protein
MRTDAVFSSADAPTNRLYRNLHNGRFEDVTDRAGLRRTGWASGVCAGDYDNDGWIDLYVTYFGSNVLYHNLGGGRFEDVTSRAGLVGKGVRWGSGAPSSTSIATGGSTCSWRTICDSICRPLQSRAAG